jgi:ectoine hydroxylase-related dioxygenase (phytanoyl-CoA dioxygenase family)
MDGLIADGPAKRRFLRERHAWILGMPLTETTPGASPLVVWPGSHTILQAAIGQALADVPETQWGETDITDVYQAARKSVFASCRRTPLFTRPGEAVLLHPMLLHGVAPWQAGSTASGDGRMFAYLRPETGESGRGWLGRN